MIRGIIFSNLMYQLQKKYLYLGKTYEVVHRQNQKNIVELADKLYIASNNPKYVRTYLLAWYKQQARRVIANRVMHYSRISGVQFQSIRIGSTETQWGSCSSQKNLHFNWKLIMAPLPVIDYVVTHELAHIAELNHSRAFWEKVRRMYPLYRYYRTWLKRYGETLTI